MKRLLVLISLVLALALTGCAPTMHSAAQTGNVAQLEQFLAQGYNVNTAAGNKYTPLHYATLNNQPAATRFLISHGAYLNPKDNIGDTPLHNTSYSGRIEIARILIEAGADTTIRNNKGKTFLDLARNKGKTAFVSQVNAIIGDTGEANRLAEQKKLADERKKQIEANTAKEQQDYTNAHNKNTIEAYTAFLDTHSGGKNHKVALTAFATLLVRKGDNTRTADYIRAYPKLANHLPLKFALYHIGPPELTISKVIEYKKQGIGDALISAKIMSTQSPYKKFDIDEILELKGMGLSEPVIKAMMDITTEVEQGQAVRKLEADNLRQQTELEQIRNERNNLMNSQQTQPTPAAAPQEPGVAESVGNCVAQAVAVEACNEAPGGFLGQAICKAAAKASFPCN